MPLEIHLGKKYTSNAGAVRLTKEERKKFMRGDFFSLPKLPKAILRYTPNHDQESLMWVALWIVYGLVDYEKAKEIWPQIFANTRCPTRRREDFFTEGWSFDEGEFFEAFHPGLGSDCPRCFYLLRRQLYGFCILREPEEEDYHGLINDLSAVFDELLATATGKAKNVSLVVRSGPDNQANDEVGRPRNNTGYTPHSMKLRSHVQNSGPPRFRLLRQ